jgi:hypothetical protein
MHSLNLEYALQLDCDAEGCDPPHADRNMARRWEPGYDQAEFPGDPNAKLMNHAAKWLVRDLTWRELPCSND